MAKASRPVFPRLCEHSVPTLADEGTMYPAGDSLTPEDRSLLLHCQRRALRYFLDNQMPNGLVLDRQSNHGPRRPHGLCSTSATGMGFIAIALSAAPPYRLISPAEAAARLRAGLQTAWERLPNDHGILPHFIHSATGLPYGLDHLSTIDSAWLLAGALWASAFLRDPDLEVLAHRLYDRVDWAYWAMPGDRGEPGLLRHGKGADGRFLACAWDRLNGETAFMYVLAAGATSGRALPGSVWTSLRPFYGTVGGLRFNNADLGLFVFQYGLDLLDLPQWSRPGDVPLWTEARLATNANHRACRAAADRFTTYRRYWGISAGDGPGRPPRRDVYRCYAPAGLVDGTAHVMATLASVAHAPDTVLANVHEAHQDHKVGVPGRYGFSNVNLDRGWVGRDVVGIDAGAAVLALDNFLVHSRVRREFSKLPCVLRGLQRLGFVAATRPIAEDGSPQAAALRQAS
jgi:hypothetical protein